MLYLRIHLCMSMRFFLHSTKCTCHSVVACVVALATYAMSLERLCVVFRLAASPCNSFFAFVFIWCYKHTSLVRMYLWMENVCVAKKVKCCTSLATTLRAPASTFLLCCSFYLFFSSPSTSSSQFLATLFPFNLLHATRCAVARFCTLDNFPF